jgi:hypothetical protein
MAAIRASVELQRTASAAMLAGERAAIDAGAQEVRTLFSLDGGLTLQPFEMHDGRPDPLQVYVAVRKSNYWAEGFACISNELQPATALARVLLDNALAAIRPGIAFSQIAKITAVSEPYRRHPVTEGGPITSVGLDLDAPGGASQVLEAGGVYSLRVGLTDGGEQHAIVSAMIALHEHVIEELWRSSIA